MFRSRHAIVLALAVPTLIALTGGCSEDEKATPQVIFEGRIERGGSDNDCQDTSELFKVGDFGNPALEPPVASKSIPDGSAYDQGTVSVSCSVVPSGPEEFTVAGSVDLSGATGGFFRIDGKFKTTGEQTGIHAIFSSRRTTNTYEQLDRNCTVRYTTAFQGVASGRVWGEVTCPRAENVNAQKQCEGIAQFRFENCAQE